MKVQYKLQVRGDYWLSAIRSTANEILEVNLEENEIFGSLFTEEEYTFLSHQFDFSSIKTIEEGA